ncbi:hypothetical protein VNO78_04558 [Psophocarpus tetragonolobus]|uniref:Uncharacterized protein n=1 Tax=Psophocarpus tetragonolobus TaxID=3891 RepID=A0AAN9XXJ6_PSOTE
MSLAFRGIQKAICIIILLRQSISLVSLCAVQNIYAVADICFVVLYVVWLRKCATDTYSFRSKQESPS